MTDSEREAAEKEKERLLDARKKQRANQKNKDQDAPLDPGLQRASYRGRHGADRASF